MVQQIGSISNGFVIAAVLGFAILVLVPTILMEVRATRRRRRQHVESRSTVTAEEFLQQIGVAGDVSRIALGVRESIGLVMGVPTATVYATDSFGYISKFQFDGLDFLDIKLFMQGALEVRIPNKCWQKLEHTEVAKITVDDLIKWAIKNWSEFTPVIRSHQRKYKYV